MDISQDKNVRLRYMGNNRESVRGLRAKLFRGAIYTCQITQILKRPWYAPWKQQLKTLEVRTRGTTYIYPTHLLFAFSWDKIKQPQLRKNHG